MKEKFDVDVNKGTSYRRKQEENLRAAKTKKRSKRLSAYKDNERAKSSNMIRSYMKNHLDDED